jgi:hypothetical protein
MKSKTVIRIGWRRPLWNAPRELRLKGEAMGFLDRLLAKKIIKIVRAEDPRSGTLDEPVEFWEPAGLFWVAGENAPVSR